MRKTKMVLICVATFTIATHHLISAATIEDVPKRGRMADKPYIATMSYGAYSSKMSSDRKTIIQTADGRIVAEEIYSPNKRCYAFADLRTNVTTVYEVIRAGNVGRRVPLWTMDGCQEMVGLSNDGRCLVVGYEGMSTIPIDYREDEPMLFFFTTGEETGCVGLDRIITDFSKLERDGSDYYWGRYLGFNAAGDFAVETVEGEMILFDVEGAERVTYAHAESAEISHWKTYRDLLRCYEYRYPETHVLEESLTHEGRPAGRTSLKRGDGEPTITAEVEEPGTYPPGMYDPAGISLGDFVIERAKLRCSADGPNSSMYAGDVATQEVFENPHGRSVVRFHLSVIRESYDEGTMAEEMIWGPYYAISISQQGKPYRVLMFEFSEKAGGETPRDEALLRRIVDTVRILR